MTDGGYSGTPIAKKLGIKPGWRFWAEGPSDRPTSEALAQGDAVLVGPGEPFDVAVLFVEWREDAVQGLARLIPLLDQRGGIWVAWPKRASGRATDLSDGAVRDIGLATGLVDNKVCAVDETWSALRFVVRVANRV